MINNHDDVIDSRDVIARIAELEALSEPQDAEARELAALRELAAEGEDASPVWLHGATLVRDSYFVSYVRELVFDCGLLPENFPSWIEMDWQATARNAEIDYTPVHFAGVTYWVR